MPTNPKNTGTLAAAEECQRVADIINQRSGTHGDAIANLEDIGRRWQIYLNKKFGININLLADDISIMMVEMKLSRAMYGDNQEVDHARDSIGYSAIWAAAVQVNKLKEAGVNVIPTT